MSSKVSFKLTLEYDGTDFAGWQLQVGRRTVEGELRQALARLPLKLEGLWAAGRTDAGAHAEGQVVSVRCVTALTPLRLRGALNALLPADVAVLQLEEVGPTFHARYDARWRKYRYRYLLGEVRSPLHHRYSWGVGTDLQLAPMQESARALIGTHDWTTFSMAGGNPNRVREICQAIVEQRGRYIELELVGRGFLRGMVRSIAAALAEVGLGRRPSEWVGEILRARDRRLSPRPAPAAGLTLVEVEYAEVGAELV
ncbi:MAG: tRNA pseudouridine(38-40) synthase TruA [Candidatus Dormibacteraceae bacterium]